jgi:hypothetical protein
MDESVPGRRGIDRANDQAAPERQAGARRRRAMPRKRTTHRSRSGTKLYAVRDSKGRFVDIQTYKRAHAADLKRKSKAETAKKKAKKTTKKKVAKKKTKKKATRKK